MIKGYKRPIAVKLYRINPNTQHILTAILHARQLTCQAICFTLLCLLPGVIVKTTMLDMDLQSVNKCLIHNDYKVDAWTNKNDSQSMIHLSKSTSRENWSSLANHKASWRQSPICKPFPSGVIKINPELQLGYPSCSEKWDAHPMRCRSGCRSRVWVTIRS